MKKNDIKELSKMETKELVTKLEALRKEYVEAVKKSLKRSEKNVHIAYGLKKDIARVLTFIKQKELGL